jgi:hypothetical protein
MIGHGLKQAETQTMAAGICRPCGTVGGTYRRVEGGERSRARAQSGRGTATPSEQSDGPSGIGTQRGSAV